MTGPMGQVEGVMVVIKQEIQLGLFDSALGQKERNVIAHDKQFVSAKLPGTQAIAQRQIHAANKFMGSVIEQFGLGREEASRAWDYYVVNKLVKVDAVGGQYTLVDGRLWDGDAMRKAADMNLGVVSGQAQAEPAKRGSVGASLTKEQKKAVLKTLVDVYKTKGAEKESKGLDSNGNECTGYAYQPELFEKSDITGAMVRYYVTLPDGRIAHPTELFPEYTQSDIDAEMIRRENAERNARLDVQHDYARPDVQFDDRISAAKYWDEKSKASKAKSVGGWATIHSSLDREYLSNGTKFIMVPIGVMKNGDMVEALAVEGWEKDGVVKVFEMGQFEQSEIVSEVSSRGLNAIQDAGAELVYNRRNRIKRAWKWADLVSLNDALKVKEAVKANIWPKPDYKQLIEDGMKPMVAHIVKQVYDGVAAKPVIGGREVLDDAVLQRYIAALNRIEAGVMSWANDSAALKRWAEVNARHAGAMMGQRISLSDLASEPRSLLDAVFPEGWKEYRSEVMIAGGNKLLGVLQPKFEEIKRALKAIDTGWPEKREAWEVQGYRIVENPKVEVHESTHHENKFFVLVEDSSLGSAPTLEEAQGIAAMIKPFVLFNKRRMVDSFASRDEAVDAAKGRTQREKGNTISEKGISVEAVEREGVSRRLEGEDITSERLLTEFGFKGVNFGNWMKTPSARAEAQLHLNYAYDSLHDLAEILGVPARALSLNGMLGLAIGAQGGGGNAAAHFVPGVNEINLTRTSGAGSLAHEWAHALDHYFATQAGLASSSEPFLTEHVKFGPVKLIGQIVDGKRVTVETPRFGDLRGEIVRAFGNIVEVMDKRLNTAEEAQRESEVRLAKAKSSVDNWLKAIRRDFVGQEEAFDLLAARVRSGDVGDGHVALSRNVYVSPVVVEMRGLYKQQHGRVYSLDDVKGLQAWIGNVNHLEAAIAAQVEHVPQKVSSDFAKNAIALDKEKGGKPYWGTGLEKFARAFDAFVSDELESKQAKNGYLSHTGREGNTVPMGVEREAVNAAFRGLVGELKVQETAKGVALSSFAKIDQPIQRMPRIAIDAEIERLGRQWPAMPKVKVVETVDELPCVVRRHSDGVHYDGRVYVIAENIFDLKQVQKVMAHECILHHSLESMLGDYGFAKLHSGIQALKEAGDPVVDQLAREVGEAYGVLSPMEETKEIVARAGEQCLDEKGSIRVGFGFMKGVFAGVVSWLRDKGLSFPFSNFELQGIIHNAGRWIEQDHGSAIRSTKGWREEALCSFAGVRAENAPLAALRLAREMMVSGADDRAIWKETGWTFGFADGKPRFEIADDEAVLNLGEANGAGERFFSGKLGVGISHEEFFSAYPGGANIRAFIKQADGIEESGSFVQYKNPRSDGAKDRELDAFGEDALSAVLHELQHVIQTNEDFACGGRVKEFQELDVTEKELSKLNQKVHELYSLNPEFYRDAVKATQLQIAVKEKYGSSNGDVDDPLVQEWWAAIDQRDSHPEAEIWFSLKSQECYLARDRVIVSPLDQYSRLSGEVEARLSQSRSALSTEERIATYPVDQMDVAVKDQVVRFGNTGTPIVKEGTYNGKVLDVCDGVILQKIGRAGECARHLVNRLSDKVEIGDVVNIRYEDGVGIVGKDLATEKSLAR